MASGATRALVSIALLRSGYAVINLAGTMSFARCFPFKTIHEHLSFNSRNTKFSCTCTSTVCSDVTTSVSTSISDNSYPPYVRLLPCPSQSPSPRVEHLVVSEGGPVLEYISGALSLPPLFVADLIHFGAVFYALVSPDPPPTATREQVEAFKKSTARSVLRKRSSIKGKTIREAQKIFRIQSPDDFVEAGTYLRVHVHPKRFPRSYEIDWRSRVIAVSEDYVVLDKPAGGRNNR